MLILHLIGRLVYLMVFDAEYYQQKAEDLHERERDIKAARGEIIDRNGTVLATNRTVCTISVIHSQIENPEKVIEKLSEFLEMDADQVRKKVEKISSIERIRSNVDKRTGDKIRNLGLAGVKVDEDFKRYYPYNELASKVLGFTGGDNQGIVGLEVKYEKYLKGINGKIHRNYLKLRLILFGTLALALVIASFFSESLCPYDPYLQDLGNAKALPSAEHLLGTDRYGRDMLSRVIVGSKTSIYSTLLLVGFIMVFGTMIGIFCAWSGKKTDSILMRISDVFLAFPGLVFALAVAAALGGGVHNAIIALAAISWPKYARVARSQTLAQKETVYIRAARLSGCGTGKLILKHILPNIFGPILVTAMLDIGTMMMELAGLSFLGLGAKPPVAEWGSMMSDTRNLLTTHPWVTLAPGFAIFVSVVIFNLLGDTVRDWLDPRNGR